MKKINLQDYILKKQNFELLKPSYRNLCTTCLHPEFSCYCQSIETFDPLIQFVILIHPIEFQRRIATGRMSHLILKNSILIRGQDYSNNQTVNALIQDKKNECVVLYPGKNSLNLSTVVPSERKNVFQKDKKLVVFVIDGTWATARQMMRHSLNLTNLPRVCFTPSSPSNFRVRKQPESFCLSTIEAIHQFIEISGSFVGFQTEKRQHDILLKVFNQMVERQIEFVQKYS